MSRKVLCECFALYEVSDGVFAAIDNGKVSGSNAGFIDLGGVSVIFDTFVNIDAARELSRKCRELTGREAAYVINSHSHADHIAGNCIFSDAVIISSNTTRDAIAVTREEFEKEKASYQKEINDIESILPAKTDKVEIDDLNNALFYLRNLNKPGVEFRIPDMAFDGELILHGKNRSLHLTATEAAHSRGDVVAYLPDCGVCFTGDVLCKGTHPWLGKGEPVQFLNTLKGIMDSDMKHFIPGHGELADKKDVLLEMQYISEMMELVKNKKSTDERDYSVSDLSPVFSSWEGLCFSWNIKFLIGREQNKT